MMSLNYQLALTAHAISSVGRLGASHASVSNLQEIQLEAAHDHQEFGAHEAAAKKYIRCSSEHDSLQQPRDERDTPSQSV